MNLSARRCCSGSASADNDVHRKVEGKVADTILDDLAAATTAAVVQCAAARRRRHRQPTNRCLGYWKPKA